MLFKYKMVTQVKVKSNVKNLMTKRWEKIWYEVYVNLSQETAKVSLASCLCKVDLGGCCKHVAALLFHLLDFIQLEAREVPDDLTCTKLLKQWHAFSGEKVKFSKSTSWNHTPTNMMHKVHCPKQLLIKHDLLLCLALPLLKVSEESVDLRFLQL